MDRSRTLCGHSACLTRSPRRRGRGPIGAAADARQLHAAKARASRGDVAFTQLRYGEAAGHFSTAAALLPTSSSGDRGGLLWRQAEALDRQGNELGDNASLRKSIAMWEQLSHLDYPRERAPLAWARTQNNLGSALLHLGQRGDDEALRRAVATFEDALLESTRERAPLAWAATKNNLGNALEELGKRESGTARLQEAVAAYEDALLERTRERVPLAWAMTKNNLGNALLQLGERESGTARLHEAVAAYKNALLESTRERVPLAWAMTKNNLGNALQQLGERESGTARLQEAVAAFNACLTVIKTAWPEEWVQEVRSHRDETQTEITRRRPSK